VTAPLLVIAAGGTGGHMFPAQALAEEMLAAAGAWRCPPTPAACATPAVFPRRSTGAKARGHLRARRAGRKAGRAAGAPARALEARRWFRADPPACVAGFGGYPAFPALAAAWLAAFRG
jgi:UDP-N-acetylglucosamine--N-acetylmuramyl-(pentapeptide) pyrophosphoryl-undecaprenol N-acetylglucosamine transferase